MKTAPTQAFFVNNDNNDTATTEASLWTLVTQKTKTPKINMITTRQGKIIVKPQNRESADILKQIAVQKPNTIGEDLPRKPRVIIANLDASAISYEIAYNIASQNLELGIDENKADKIISPIFKRGKRDSPTVSWICEVDPLIYGSLLSRNIYVGFYSCRVSKFEEIMQCFICYQFVHPAAKCTKSEDTCAHCSSTGHKRSTCPKIEDEPKCVNCSGKHPATDPTYSKKAITLANLQRRTDYGHLEELVEDTADSHMDTQ